MGLFDNFKKAEVRSLENPNAPVSAENFLHIMGLGDFQSSAGVTVNIDNALGVPAVWAAVNFISGTLASLPLEVYRGNERVTDGIGAWLNCLGPLKLCHYLLTKGVTENGTKRYQRTRACFFVWFNRPRCQLCPQHFYAR